MAENIAERILVNVDKNDTVDTEEFAKLVGVDHQQVVGAVKSLQSLGNVVNCEQKNYKKWELTSEGQSVVAGGSHEAVVYQAVPPDTGILQADLMKSVPNAKIGFSKAMSAGWIKMDKKAEGGPRVFRKTDKIIDKVQEQLKLLSIGDVDLSDKEKAEYKKRKLVSEITIKSFLVSKGSEFSTQVSKLDTDLTPEMIASGSWKDRKFKSYNFDALGVLPVGGHLHPLLKVRTEFRQIFLEMGFSEMPTNNFVESSFWNFDALFQPQQHPARDAHDTFFIQDPMNAHEFPMDYLERVKKVHSKGGYGSQGYQYDWKIEEARKNLLRTHTTAVSARMLYQLAQKKIGYLANIGVPSTRHDVVNETMKRNVTLAEECEKDYIATTYDLAIAKPACQLQGTVRPKFDNVFTTSPTRKDSGVCLEGICDLWNYKMWLKAEGMRSKAGRDRGKRGKSLTAASASVSNSMSEKSFPTLGSQCEAHLRSTSKNLGELSLSGSLLEVTGSMIETRPARTVYRWRI
ncbi:phenylalanine--tRNA ligase alpha subunit A-like [Saccoglossus kowalevskii]|uniref:Phenylalanine--tRNA ligase alpha subunit A-like n=1 Tax=Saccoglossus kowalevskii TaxID=10224 RepID=A0ABM0MRP0_SACKO|nr:PREDICTED: phenylalanine--tRNA ligase alpha subunit A-like [Saccoglossus kowalevskii]